MRSRTNLRNQKKQNLSSKISPLVRSHRSLPPVTKNRQWPEQDLEADPSLWCRLQATFLAGLRCSYRRRCAPDKVDGQAVFNIQMNQGSFDGKTVSFWLDFKDENEGIFAINLGG